MTELIYEGSMPADFADHGADEHVWRQLGWTLGHYRDVRRCIHCGRTEGTRVTTDERIAGL